MTIQRIFLDMDGVLVDCHNSALRAFGILTDFPLQLGQHTTVYSVLEDYGIDNLPHKSVFWDQFDHQWWSNLPKTVECDTLIHLCSMLIGYNNVFILSRPTRNPGSWSGKMEWVDRFTNIAMRNVVLTPTKWVCATPEALLVDDSAENCKLFRKHGHSVFVERPWTGYHTNFSKVREEIRKACRG